MPESGDVVILITHSGDVIVFDHLAAAADFIEAVDVIEGDYVGMFRIDGRVVRAETLHEDVRLILEDSWNNAGLRAALVGAGVVEPEADAATVRRRILELPRAGRRGPPPKA
ncbi:MAG TPA: hypothetical protein VHO26_06930 [Propionibacteriaceae bacterium]|nr:hypothetical protein [Propionibacteriaceae bacterium]